MRQNEWRHADGLSFDGELFLWQGLGCFVGCQEWVQGAVDRILALKPARVLEIGCGSGLLLFRLAPHCQYYCGTDFSLLLIVAEELLNAVLRDHIESARPRGARITLTQLDHAEPWITPTDHPLLRAGAAALTKAYGVEPVLTRSGGSIGAVHSMSRHLQTPCLLVGFVQPDCFMHAPDERLDLDSFFAGRKAALHLWEDVGQLPRSKLQ